MYKRRGETGITHSITAITILCRDESEIRQKREIIVQGLDYDQNICDIVNDWREYVLF